MKNKRLIEALDANDSAMPPNQIKINRWETHVDQVRRVIHDNVDHPSGLTVEWCNYERVWILKYARFGCVGEYRGLITQSDIRNRRIEVSQVHKEHDHITPIAPLIETARELTQLVDDDLVFIMRAIAAAEGDAK